MAVAAWKLRAGKGKYCSNDCKYKFRVRPSGLRYQLKVENPAWIKPGEHLSTTTEFQPGVRNNPSGEISPGEHRGLLTQFRSGVDHPHWKGGYYARLYGISAEEWESQRLAQAGCCAICGKQSSKLDTDHDHLTGRVRGLLCGNCNRGIGLLKDDPTILQKAKEYLDNQGVWR